MFCLHKLYGHILFNMTCPGSSVCVRTDVHYRIKNALEAYELGIERQARPTERLRRIHAEYKSRIESDPTLWAKVQQSARTALSLKQQEDTDLRTASSESKQQSCRQTPSINIYRDDQDTRKIGAEGWDSIATLQTRRKENTIDPIPWTGQKMPQKSAGSRGADQAPRLDIYRDSELKVMVALYLFHKLTH